MQVHAGVWPKGQDVHPSRGSQERETEPRGSTPGPQQVCSPSARTQTCLPLKRGVGWGGGGRGREGPCSPAAPCPLAVPSPAARCLHVALREGGFPFPKFLQVAKMGIKTWPFLSDPPAALPAARVEAVVVSGLCFPPWFPGPPPRRTPAPARRSP